MIKSIKGFKDIFDEDAAIFREIETLVSQIAKSFGYHYIILPTAEYSELFNRSVGEETDIVEKEMYTFEDKGGRSITLRPEITASVARSFIENHFETSPSPFKVYYFGQCFRYENPQKGRFREFYQFGVEAFGDESPILDVEVIQIAFEILKKLEIENTRVKINSIGCKECRPNYRDALIKALEPHYEDLCDDCKRRLNTNPLRILDCKKEAKELKDSLPKNIDFLCDKCKNHLNKTLRILQDLKIPYEIDNTLVRGLDYYTRTVFEVVSDDLGAQNALIGGGRYDYLVEQLGGRPTPAVGFAMGIERLIEVLKGQSYKTTKKTIVYVIYFEETLNKALEISSLLRENGFITLLDQKGGNLKGQLERSAKKNSDFAVIIGEDEIKRGTLQVKNMNTKEQKETNITELIETIKEWGNA